MINGSGALAVVYSGDAVWCADPDEGNPDLDFFVPEGSNIYFDNMVIPKNSQKKELVEQFINYLLDPEVAARNTEFVEYSSANAKVLDILGDDWKNNHTYNIPKEDLETLVIFRDLDANMELYDAAWDRVFK